MSSRYSIEKKKIKFDLCSEYSLSGDQPKAVEIICNAINSDENKICLQGVTGSGKTFSMANVIYNLQRPALILAHNKTLAAQLYAEMKEFFPHNAVQYFVSYYDYYQPEAYVPSSDTYIEKDASINEYVDQMRLSATKSLLTRTDCIIVASVSAIYGLGDPSSYLEMTLLVEIGKKIERSELLRQLVILQYQRNDVNLHRGSFRVNGEVIDIVPSDLADDFIRIELFDDEVEKISVCDLLTGKLVEKIDTYELFPKNHYVTPKERVDAACITIAQELDDRLLELEKNGQLVERQRLKDRTLCDLEFLKELGFCSGVENYSRHLTGAEPGAAPPTLLNYLADDTILFIDESHVTIPQIRGMYLGDKARKNNLVDYGFRLPSARDNRPLTFDEFSAYRFSTVYVSATLGNFELEQSSVVAEQIVRPTGLLDPEIIVLDPTDQVHSSIAYIQKNIANGGKILVTVLTKRMAENLTDFIKNLGIGVSYLHSDVSTLDRIKVINSLRLGEIDCIVGINLLREGLDIPEVDLVIILDADKEGFLRSRQALIQTAGRAARNSNGRVIMFGKMTASMQSAIDETNRRRCIQTAYNKKHSIIPKTVHKSVERILDPDEVNDKITVDKVSAKDVAKSIKQVESEMLLHAGQLNFDRAAELKLELQRLRKLLNDI